VAYLSNQDLRRTLLVRLQATGRPTERVREGQVSAAQVYRIISGADEGKTVRVRTNRAWALIANASDSHWNAPIPLFDDVDFVAAACINSQGQAEFYLIPASRVIEDMRAAHQAYCERRNQPSGSNVRALYFAADPQHRPWFGKYAEFRLTATANDANELGSAEQPPPRRGDAIERAHRLIADEFDVPLQAVHISVELVPGRVIAHLEATGLPLETEPSPRPEQGPERWPRPGTKRAVVIEMLLRPEGCTKREVLAATGWGNVSIAGIAHNYGLDVRSVVQPGGRRYFASRSEVVPVVH
jgi:hypothetical protein